MRTIRIGSRESKLAVIQSQMVMEYIEKNHHEIKTELITMKTTGDIILDRSLDKIGGKGLFVKELDMALLDGRSDLSVHSLKDMPMEISEKLPIVAFSRREDPRDALILPKGVTKLDPSLPIGCSSKRRELQIKELFPELSFKGIRGNVITRLEKLDRGEYSGIILAVSGLKRLGLEERISRIFTIEESLPAAGQGILAIQGRTGEDYEFLKGFHDKKAAYEALAERAFVKRLDGGCSSPVAAHGIMKDNEIHITGLYFDESSGNYSKGSISGDISKAEELGRTLADSLRRGWMKDGKR